MHGRRLAILTAGNVFVATSFMSVSGLLNEISAGLNLDIQQAGSLIAAFAVTAGVGAPILATFGSRIDRRLLLTVALAIGALANMSIAFCEQYWQLVLARVVGAIASAVYTPQVAATVSMTVTERERGPVLTKLMMGWAIGAVAGGPLTVYIGDAYGWRISFGAIGLGGVLISFFVWRAIPVGIKVPPLNLQRWLDIARHPTLVLLTFTTMLATAGNHFVFSFLAPTLLQMHGASGKTIAAVLLVNGLGGLVGGFLTVQAITRYGAARVSYSGIGLIALIFAIWPFGALLFPLVFVMQFFWSVGVTGVPSVQQTRFVTVAPTLASATIALNSSVGYLGNSLGTKLGSYAWDWVGGRFLPWLGMLFTLAALAFSMRAERSAKNVRKEVMRLET